VKTALIFLALALIILIAACLALHVEFTPTTIDIHFSDTYLVVNNFHALLVAVLWLLTFFSIGGMIGTRSRSILFVSLFFVSVLCYGFLIWRFRDLLDL